MQKVQVYGVEDTIRKLQLFQPELIRESRKDLRVAAEPVAQSIRDYIPNEPPMRGFRHNGRTSWQPNVPVSVRTDFSKRAFKREESLVKIVVGGKKGTLGAAGLQIADMAGRRNKVRTGGNTRKFVRQGVEVQRRINPNSARNMIDVLNGRFSSPSRFVWRAAMLHVPKVQASVMGTLDRLMKETNQKLLVKD